MRYRNLHLLIRTGYWIRQLLQFIYHTDLSNFLLHQGAVQVPPVALVHLGWRQPVIMILIYSLFIHYVPEEADDQREAMLSREAKTAL